jgi:hypothetical protein
MIYCERGSDWGWEWALTRKPSMLAQPCGLQRSALVICSLAPPLVVPLGRTPPYLDPKSQEATYEVDVSGMPINVFQSESR